MLSPEYYRAYVFALREGHGDVAAALTTEGEERGTLVYVEVLSWIVHGGEVGFEDTYKRAFLLAAQKDHFLIMRALLDVDAVIFDRVDLHCTLLHAIQARSMSAVITLLAHGTPVDQCAIQAAADCGCARLSRIMLRELWLRS